MAIDHPTTAENEALASLIDFLTAHGIPFQENVSVSSFSWISTAASCNCVITPTSTKALSDVLRFCSAERIPHKVIGNTSNCFFPGDERFTCLVRTCRLNRISIDWDRQELTAECGASLSSLALRTANLGIGGFVGMVGIPGTVGGAVFMNAGSYGDTISATLKRIELLDSHGQCHIVDTKEVALGYRTSALRTGQLRGTVLNAVFHVNCENVESLQRRLASARSQRNTTQEKQLPNLGSLFATQFIYEDIAKHHPFFRVLLRLYFWIFYRVARWVFCWTPPPSYLNSLTLWWFRKSFPIQPFSDFTMNCYVRRSEDDAVFFDYVNWVRGLTNNTVELENEVVREQSLK